MTGRDHGGGRGDRPADQPVVDGLPGGLDPGAEHGVRRAADRDAGCPRSVQDLAGLRRRGRERLLTVDGFAGGNRAQGDLGVGCRDGQVQDEFDVVGGQQPLDRECPDAIIRVGYCLRPGGVQVRDGDEVDVLEPAEVRQVLRDDGSTANDSNVCWLVWVCWLI